MENSGLSSGERKEQIRDYLGSEDAKIAWVDLKSDAMDNDSLLLGCDSEAVELLLIEEEQESDCLLYTSPSPRDGLLSRMPSSA